MNTTRTDCCFGCRVSARFSCRCVGCEISDRYCSGSFVRRGWRLYGCVCSHLMRYIEYKPVTLVEAELNVSVNMCFVTSSFKSITIIVCFLFA